jgi:hypothetical protein
MTNHVANVCGVIGTVATRHEHSREQHGISGIYFQLQRLAHVWLGHVQLLGHVEGRCCCGSRSRQPFLMVLTDDKTRLLQSVTLYQASYYTNTYGFGHGCMSLNVSLRKHTQIAFKASSRGAEGHSYQQGVRFHSLVASACRGAVHHPPAAPHIKHTRINISS